MAARSVIFDLIARDGASLTFDKVGATAIANARKVDTLAASTEKAGAAAQGSVSKFGAMYKGLAALATVDVGVHLVKMAANFEYQMNRMVTAAGESQKNLKMVSNGVLNLMGATGTGAADLEKGLYQIESAGYHGAQGLNILKVAAEGAKIENASLGTVANAVTSAMVDYHVKAGDASKVMNTLIAAVAHGKTTLEEMSIAFSNVGAAGAQAHVPMADLTAAIATMTMHGTDAAKAGTYLRQVIGQLEGGSAKARLVMAGLGLDANQVAQTLSSGPGGLARAIGMLDDAITRNLTPSGLVAIETFKKSKGSLSDFQRVLGNLPPSLVSTFSALANMTGGVKSLQGFLQLGGENLKTFKANTDAVNEAVKKGGKSVEGWASTSKQLSVQLDMLRHGAEAVGIRIGMALIPLVQKAIDAFKNIWNVIKPLAHDVGVVLVAAWHALSDALTVVGHALSDGIIGTALRGLYHLLNSNRGILMDLGKAALAMWAGFKGVTLAVTALKALDGALLATRIRMVALADSFTAVAAGEAVMSWGAMATGIGAVMLAGYALGKSLSNIVDKGSGAVYVIDNLSKVQQSFAAAVEASNGALDEQNRRTIGAAAQQSGLAVAAGKAGISLRELIQGIGGGTDAMGALITRWQEAGGLTDDNKVKLLALAATYLPLAQNARDLAAATKAQTTVTYGSANAAEHATATSTALAVAQTKQAQAARSASDTLAVINKAYGYASESAQTFLDAVNAFNKSAGTTADRAALIGATLKAANGDALNFAGKMNAASAAAAQLGTDMASAAKGVGKSGESVHDFMRSIVNLKTGTIDYSKSAAAPLINDLTSMQTAAMAAAQAMYAHERATKGGKVAADDAAKVYQSMTRGALVDQAKQLGLTRGQAKKLADQYFGMPKNVKTLIEQEGANPIVDVLNRIGALLAKFTGQPWDVKITATTDGIDAAIGDLSRLAGSIQNVAARGAQNRLAGILAGRATGGGAPEGWFAVGEQGPELVHKAGSTAHVYSNAQSKAILAATGMRAPGFAGGTGGHAPTGTNLANVVSAFGALAAAAHNIMSTAADLAAATAQLRSSAQAAGASAGYLRTLTTQSSTLITLGRRRDTVLARLGTAPTAPTAYDRLATAQQAYNTARGSGTAVGAFDITTAGVTPQLYNDRPAPPVSATTMLAALTAKVAKAKRFTYLIKRMIQLKLPKSFVEQFVAAGPDAATQAEALIQATPAQLALFRSDAKALDAASAGAGLAVANGFYKSGVDSAQGLVNGLLSQKKALDHAIKTLGDGMVAQLKRTLHIKSPSRVMHELGVNTAEGYRLGIASKHDAIANEARKMGDQVTKSHHGQHVSAGGTVINNHWEIHPAQGMDEQQIAAIASRRMAALVY